jgi:flagella basal body P-ring formation protein FlgA
MMRFLFLMLTAALSAWLVFSLPAAAQDAVAGAGAPIYTPIYARADAQPGDAAAPDGDDDSGGLTLKDRVMVNDDVVRLGDLFTQPVSMGDSPVAQAPLPGQTIVLDNRFLRSLVRAYQLDWAPKSKYQRVLVGRVSQEIPAAKVTAQVKAALRDYLGTDKDVEISFDVGDVEFTLPTNVPPTVSVQDVRFDPASQRFAAQLVVPASGPALISRLVAGTVYQTIQLPVLSHPVAPGDVIQSSDLDWLPVRLDRIAPNAATDPRQLVGMTARRPLRQEQMLRVSDVTMAAAIHRGSAVTLMVKTENMLLTAQGRALEDAALGQPIRVVNTASNKQLTGIVQNGTTVAIQIAGAMALN